MEFLQLFASAGDVVTTSAGYVNAATGDGEAFESGNTLSQALKTFYDTELLENAKPELIFAQFAKRQALPRNRGTTVEWRKWNTFDKAPQLQEGVIPTGQKFGMSSKTGTINQYGTYATISDRLDLHAYDDIILGATEEMAASLAQTQESLIRQALMTNTNVLYCDNIAPDGTYIETPMDTVDMDATSEAMAALTPDMVAKAVTLMKKNRVPTINGKYVAIIHPSVAYDLRKSSAWIEAHKYAAPNEIYNGEIGELHGCRFIESVFAPVVGGGMYENRQGGVTYATFFLGKDAFGIIDPEEGAEMVIHDKSQIGGPLNQYSTVGYKLETNGATVLYTERVLRLMSCSSFSESDQINMEEV